MDERISGNALVYTRRRLDVFFHGVAERTFGGEITYFSDWPGLENINIMEPFYKYYKARVHDNPFSDSDIEQIIKRCPLLTDLPREQAELMVSAMYHSIRELVEKTRPVFLLSVIVDNYLTDILFRVCKRYGVVTIGICNGLKNTILVTSYGEFNKVRDPDDSEVVHVLSELSEDGNRVDYGMKINDNQYSFLKHMKEYFKRATKAIAFEGMKIYHKDPLNYRLLVGTRFGANGLINFSNYKCINYYHHDWDKQIENSSLTPMFLPLAHIPEASTCYWLKDIRCLNYDKFIIDLCNKLNKHYLIVIKDHWSMLGLRSWKFYEQLLQIPGVVMVPTHVNSRLVMKLIDRILVEVGTAGVEAAVRGKKVVTLGKPYFYLEGHYLDINGSEELSKLPDMLEKFTPPAPDNENQCRVVRRFLESSFAGSILFDNRLNTDLNINTVSIGLRRRISKMDL